jgi:transposase
VRIPTEEEEQKRAIHRQREQLVKARKQLEAQGRSLLLNHGFEPTTTWWKPCTFALLQVPEWMKELLSNSQPILLALQEKIRALTQQLQAAAGAGQPRGFGALSSVVIDREVENWTRFKNRRQVGSYTGLCPGEYSSGNTRVQCVTKQEIRVERRWWRQLGAWSVQPTSSGASETPWQRRWPRSAQKKAIVAWRQLAVDLWRIRTGRVKAEALGLS